MTRFSGGFWGEKEGESRPLPENSRWLIRYGSKVVIGNGSHMCGSRFRNKNYRFFLFSDRRLTPFLTDPSSLHPAFLAIIIALGDLLLSIIIAVALFRSFA